MNHGTILYYSMQSSASGHLINGGDEKSLKLRLILMKKGYTCMTGHTKVHEGEAEA